MKVKINCTAEQLMTIIPPCCSTKMPGRVFEAVPVGKHFAVMLPDGHCHHKNPIHGGWDVPKLVCEIVGN